MTRRLGGLALILGGFCKQSNQIYPDLPKPSVGNGVSEHADSMETLLESLLGALLGEIRGELEFGRDVVREVGVVVRRPEVELPVPAADSPRRWPHDGSGVVAVPIAVDAP